MVFESVPVASLLKVICDQQETITALQKSLAAKDEIIREVAKNVFSNIHSEMSQIYKRLKWSI